ncbi:DUF3732 domain-containing protein [Dickeya solani]|uniref:DUF3732 domain-containing protein n=1 Tax=Dickeya solani TaxID=1089444 RepID=A0ABU4EFS0_9GAMM|nr:DUF3732 domain-containing protein [Dickeya solani]MCA7000049.1 DUF3732 domain-containing protein [Dickeya solani]MDV6995330.1 DUF3732 domain-containing protein [Dickeya solani]MDV7004952.1 DUF3732 domain-containing protein [Dickeya solani]MDV7040070.1 DUF3732 domain-containing protein [Dickeya solani]MDV7042864.1 DUF3732 domain-containing protein [Dickeya solani]
MKAIIDSINIFNEKGEHRVVEFQSGINVITGDSKTGKSALLEIVDYCLFSKTSSIPKGIITTFSSFYSVVFKMDRTYIIIGRAAPKTGKSSKAYIKQELDKSNISPLTLDYFNQIIPITLKAAQSKFESFLGLSVLDMKDDENSFHHGKASIRNAVSLLFQHQNLIANKHALFYRFHDFVKRDRTIKELPIFLGWVDGNYYRLIRELDDNYKKLRTQEKLERHAKNTQEENKIIIKNLIEEYLAFIDFNIPENQNYQQLLNIAKNLPLVPDVPHGSTQNESLYQNEINELAQYNIELVDINKNISQLENCSNLSIDHAIDLNKIRNTFDIATLNKTTCPLCSHENVELSVEIGNIHAHQEKLVSDLTKLQFFYEDASNELEKLIIKRDSLKRSIRISNAKIKNFEKNKDELLKIKNFREKANFMRGKVSTLISVFLNKNDIIDSGDNLSELRNKIKKIESDIAKYNLSEKYEKHEKYLNTLMTRICNKLDFEDELKPADLHFSLKDFDFYHIHNKQQIRLHEMGSGANWLACHLSLFLSLLYLLSIEKKSCIPAFLFLDQPSQVYFPSESEITKEKASDLKQVENIFNMINSVLSFIEEKSGFMPQVIILEHADHLELKDIKFETIVRKRWKENGEKLI